MYPPAWPLAFSLIVLPDRGKNLTKPSRPLRLRGSNYSRFNLIFKPPASLKTPSSPRENFAVSGPGFVKELTPPGCDPADGCRFSIRVPDANGKAMISFVDCKPNQQKPLQSFASFAPWRFKFKIQFTVKEKLARYGKQSNRKKEGNA